MLSYLDRIREKDAESVLRQAAWLDKGNLSLPCAPNLREQGKWLCRTKTGLLVWKTAYDLNISLSAVERAFRIHVQARHNRLTVSMVAACFGLAVLIATPCLHEPAPIDTNMVGITAMTGANSTMSNTIILPEALTGEVSVDVSVGSESPNDTITIENHNEIRNDTPRLWINLFSLG